MTGYIETYRGMVTAWHCDHQGHMNTVQFHAMFDQAGWQMLTQAGYGAARLRADNRGFVDVRMELEYLGEMLVGDPVVIDSGVVKLGSTSLTYRSRMYRGNGGDIVATATCTTVHFDLDKRAKTPIPDDLRPAFAALQVAEA
jgi:acyl-CoA thioester hydrolase